MSDPPVPMPWSGGGHQPQDGATSVVPARLRASYLCPELRHWPANAKALCAHCSQHTGGRAGRDSLPVTARKPMGWVGSAASPPLPTTRARCTQSRQLRSGSRSPLSPTPGELQQCPEHPVPPSRSAARTGRGHAETWSSALGRGRVCRGWGYLSLQVCKERKSPCHCCPCTAGGDRQDTPISVPLVLEETLCSQFTCGPGSRGLHSQGSQRPVYCHTVTWQRGSPSQNSLGRRSSCAKAERLGTGHWARCPVTRAWGYLGNTKHPSHMSASLPLGATRIAEPGENLAQH